MKSTEIDIVAFLDSVNTLLSEVLRRDASAEEVMQSVCAIAQKVTGADGAVIEMVEGDEMVYRIARGTLSSHVGLRVARAGSLSGVAVAQREMQICDDCENDPRVNRAAVRRIGARSMIVVPIGAGEQSAGVLKVASGVVDGFGPREIEILKLLAGVMTTAIERAHERELHEEVERTLESSKRMTSLGQLSAMIAHEINNVLMGISPFAELIDRATADEKIKKAVQNIRRSVERGKRVTAEVLGFVGARNAEMRKIELASFFRELYPELLSLLGSRASVDLVVPEHLTVVGDEKQLAQVIVNLALNAKDAMRPGGNFRIEVGPAAPALVERSKIDSTVEYVDICVIDDGEGMEEAVAKRIFEPLFTTKQKGTGLGLSIVYQVVKAHRGDVTVDSAPGRGTVFHVILPRDGEVTTSAGALIRDARTVLLIEDDLSVGAGITAALEDEGIVVRWKKDGCSGVDAFSDDVDAVILDLRLPDCDGREVFDRLRNIRSGIPIIFSTGHGDETTLSDYLALPNVALLKKPYEISEIVRILRGG